MLYEVITEEGCGRIVRAELDGEMDVEVGDRRDVSPGSGGSEVEGLGGTHRVGCDPREATVAAESASVIV